MFQGEGRVCGAELSSCVTAKAPLQGCLLIIPPGPKVIATSSFCIKVLQLSCHHHGFRASSALRCICGIQATHEALTNNSRLPPTLATQIQQQRLQVETITNCHLRQNSRCLPTNIFATSRSLRDGPWKLDATATLWRRYFRWHAPSN